MRILPAKFHAPSFRADEASRALLSERRNAARTPVIKSAKLIVGEGFSQGVYNCLVLDESAGGVLVDLGAIFALPDEVVLHMVGGATHRARRCWAVGTKAGLEFIGAEIVSADTTAQMVEIAKLMRTQGVPAALAALRAQRFFGHDSLREAAEETEANYYKLEAMLRDH